MPSLSKHAVTVLTERRVLPQQHADARIPVCGRPGRRLYLMESGYDGLLLHVGAGADVTIRELAELVMKWLGFQRRIVFDVSKPDGTLRKLMDVSRVKQLGWSASTKLEASIEQAYLNFLSRQSPTGR